MVCDALAVEQLDQAIRPHFEIGARVVAQLEVLAEGDLGGALAGHFPRLGIDGRWGEPI
jgi:hypothetical protein